MDMLDDYMLDVKIGNAGSMPRSEQDRRAAV